MTTPVPDGGSHGPFAPESAADGQPSSRDDLDLAAAVAQIEWYHSVELPGGVVTPGQFDLRPCRDRVPLPPSLSGMRCLDVGTWDGFWAFEMEKRGADSVVAIDIDDSDQWDWPPVARLDTTAAGGRAVVDRVKGGARGFHLARRALGSSVERLDLNVYDLRPEDVGTFDLVFLGSLLLHVRDPVLALARLRSVCRGQAVIADTVEVVSSLLRPVTPTARLEAVDRPWWWLPNVAALRRMVTSAGFEVLEQTGIYLVPFGAGWQPGRMPRLTSLLTAGGREQLIARWRRGVPHAAVRARPRG